MGVHEVPKKEQPKLFAEVYRIIKPGGKFVIWELALDEENQRIFQDVIRKKDELAGFTDLVKNRYLPRHDELRELFAQTGFVDVKDHFEMLYEPSTLGRKDELVSKDRKHILGQQGQIFLADEERLKQLSEERVAAWSQYVRERVPLELREKMGYRDLGAVCRGVIAPAPKQGVV